MNGRRQKYQRGSVYLDPKRKVWVYRWKDHATGVRRNERLGTLAEIPTKAKALRLAAAFMPAATRFAKLPPSHSKRLRSGTWRSVCRSDSPPAVDTVTTSKSTSCPSGELSISAQSNRSLLIAGS